MKWHNWYKKAKLVDKAQWYPETKGKKYELVGCMYCDRMATLPVNQPTFSYEWKTFEEMTPEEQEETKLMREFLRDPEMRDKIAISHGICDHCMKEKHEEIIPHLEELKRELREKELQEEVA